MPAPGCACPDGGGATYSDTVTATAVPACVRTDVPTSVSDDDDCSVQCPECENVRCRVTGGGIVCAGEGQCCDPVSGACAANTGSGGNTVVCLENDLDDGAESSVCRDAFGDTFPTCTFCTTDPNGGAQIEKATFGGQVGAPYVIPGCHLNAECVQGNWTHQRHKKHGSLHAPEFYNVVCDCDNGDGTSTPGVCGDRETGPEPPVAPANKICFTGTALWRPTAGRREIPVAIRVEIEDRGEPGGGNNAGNLDDVYRMRIWFGSSTADAVEKAEAACCDFDIGSVISNIGFPNVLDGGNLIHGNLQIHKLTGNPTNNPPFPDECTPGGDEPNP